MKKLVLFLFVALLAFAQTASLATLPDITGTGASVALTPGAHTYAHWLRISAPAANTAAVEFGDSNVSATRGSAITSGTYELFPTVGQPYDLSTIYVYVASGDKVKVTYLAQSVTY